MSISLSDRNFLVPIRDENYDNILGYFVVHFVRNDIKDEGLNIGIFKGTIFTQDQIWKEMYLCARENDPLGAKEYFFSRCDPLTQQWLIDNGLHL